MATNIATPAISREIEFVSHNWRVIEPILEKKSSPLFEITNSVWRRAQDDTDVLLRKLEQEASAAVRGMLRIGWVNTDRGYRWESKAKVFMPRGPKRSIASMGFCLGDNLMALRLIGWIWPRRGGLDGRREFVRICQKKIRGVCLASESPKNYPGWSEDDDGIVWFDKKISVNTSFDELAEEIRRQIKAFFRTAKPVLVKLGKL